MATSKTKGTKKKKVTTKAKTPAKKIPVKKTVAKKAPVKKVVTKKAAPKKTTKKVVAKKRSVAKTTKKVAPKRKPTAKKPVAKKTTTPMKSVETKTTSKKSSTDNFWDTLPWTVLLVLAILNLAAGLMFTFMWADAMEMLWMTTVVWIGSIAAFLSLMGSMKIWIWLFELYIVAKEDRLVPLAYGVNLIVLLLPLLAVKDLVMFENGMCMYKIELIVIAIMLIYIWLRKQIKESK